MSELKPLIFIEGFWKVGKSSIMAKLVDHLSCSIFGEPDHLIEKIKDDVEAWYIDQHTESLRNLEGAKNKIIERSLLSSAAFLYAAGEKDENDLVGILRPYLEFNNRNKPVVIFIYADRDLLRKKSIEVRDERVSKLQSHDEFLEKYEYFYRILLPLQFGIVPLMVKIDEAVIAASYLPTVAGIESALKHDRFGQVNVACYKINNSEPEFLLLKRNPQKGSFWQVVTGGIKSHQSLTEAALTELAEELSLDSKVENLMRSDFSFYYVGSEGYELNEYVFGYRLNEGEEVTLSDEHVESKFVNIEEAISLLKYESNKKALRSIYEKLAH